MKRLIVLLCILACASGLTGCESITAALGGSGGSNSSPSGGGSVGVKF